MSDGREPTIGEEFAEFERENWVEAVRAARRLTPEERLERFFALARSARWLCPRLPDRARLLRDRERDVLFERLDRA